MVSRYLSFPAMAYRNRRKQRNLPSMLTHIVTFRCNAKCVMCDSWKKGPQDELSLAEIENIYRQLPSQFVVRLSGGEPFVRRDLPDIAALVQRHLKPQVLHITTNGFRTQDIVDFCRTRDQSQKLELLVSLDGVEATHNRIRQHSEAWNKTLATLKTLAPQRKAWNFSLAVNQTVVDEQGIRDYPRLRDQLAPLGVEVQVVLAYAGSATYSENTDWQTPMESPEDYPLFTPMEAPVLQAFFDTLMADTKKMRWEAKLGKRYYFEGLRNRLQHKRAYPNPPCVALSSHMRLMPNGDVPTCQFNGTVAGNLREQSFQEFWDSETSVQQREWVTRCKGCWAECEVVPNAVSTLDILRTAF